MVGRALPLMSFPHREGLGDTVVPVRLPCFVLERPPQLLEPQGLLHWSPWAPGLFSPTSPS